MSDNETWIVLEDDSDSEAEVGVDVANTGEYEYYIFGNRLLLVSCFYHGMLSNPFQT